MLIQQHDGLQNLHSQTNRNKKTEVTKQHKVTQCSLMYIKTQQNTNKNKETEVTKQHKVTQCSLMYIKTQQNTNKNKKNRSNKTT